MWNDEDNNPYGTSFDHRRDSTTTVSTAPDSPISPTNRDCKSTRRFEGQDVNSLAPRTVDPIRPRTPTGASDDEAAAAEAAYHRSRGSAGGEEEAVKAERPRRRKPGGYDSRIEQILYENPSLPILITDAGKSMESGGRYIVYTIRTGVWPRPTCLVSRL
jgi:sorting nexin-41/42